MSGPRSATALLAAAAILAAAADPLFDVVDAGAPVEERGVSRGAAWGDYDGDGDPDLFVTRPVWDGPPQRNRLYRNDGAGEFTPVDGEFARPGDWEGVVWVDVDNDGDLDLHIVGRNGTGSALFENDGAGGLTERRGVLAEALVASSSMACWADADGDGRLDVFVVGYGPGRNALFRNLGGWRFAAVTLPEAAGGEGASRACAWGDLDGDGLPELAVANARRPNLLLRNRGATVLETDTTTALQHDIAYGYGISFTDVNEDGLRDLFIANFDADNMLLIGGRDGGLVPVTGAAGLQSAATKGHVWADFDLDGRIDVYLGSGTPSPGMLNRLYLGEGGGRFRLTDEGVYAMHADTSAAVAGADYDLDGDVDLFVANWGSRGSVNRMYRNRTQANAWVRVELEGVRSNRMGIGARVALLARTAEGPRWQFRWIDAATGYGGQNEPVAHFGLGAAAAADSIVVDWPSGVVDRFGATAGGTTLRVREGAGASRPPSRPEAGS